MTVRCFTTGSSGLTASPSQLITFDTDGIPFILDTGADCVICNVRALFEDLKPMDVYVKTANGTEKRRRYVGTFNLQLPDNDGVIHSYKIPDAVYDPHTEYNILGVSYLCKFFGDAAKSRDPKAIDGTRATTGGTRTHFVWDHGKHELHFLHHNPPGNSSGLPILYLYKGTSYFQAFATRLSSLYEGVVHYAFSSAYSIAPTNDATENEGDETEWYDPTLCQECSPSQSEKRKCSYKFELGESLLYLHTPSKKKKNKKQKTSVQSMSVVYEGVNADGTTHIVRLQDGTKLAVTAGHESRLQKHLQPSFSNLPETPLDYQDEVGRGITQEEAQRLARPTILSPIQQELLSWHHRLYHLKFKRIFTLARLGILPKRL